MNEDKTNADIETENLRDDLGIENTDTITLPTKLAELCRKQLVVAAGICIGSASFAIAMKNGRFLMFMVFALLLAYRAFNIRKSFFNGAIVEEAVICTSVRRSVVKDSVVVSFRTDEDTPRFFQFVVPDKRLMDQFIPNATYIVYFNIYEQTRLLAYIAA